MHGELGWRKLEERREEKKVFGRRMWELEDDRLVKVIVDKMKEAGGVGWREGFEVLVRKYALEDQD